MKSPRPRDTANRAARWERLSADNLVIPRPKTLRKEPPEVVKSRCVGRLLRQGLALIVRGRGSVALRSSHKIAHVFHLHATEIITAAEHYCSTYYWMCPERILQMEGINR
jgi:hypothetical protein